MDSIENSAVTNTQDMFHYTGDIIRQSMYDINRDNYSGYMWVACLDSSTCMVCAALDSKIFVIGHGMELLHDQYKGTGGSKVIDEPAPPIPIHPNCRCVMVPVMAGLEETYTSAPNYEDWLSRRTDNELINILGPARFAMYKKGETIDRFVKDNRVTTLEELGVERITRDTALELLEEMEEEAKDIFEELLANKDGRYSKADLELLKKVQNIANGDGSFKEKMDMFKKTLAIENPLSEEWSKNELKGGYTREPTNMELQKISDKWASALNAKYVNAILEYTSGSDKINGYLRGTFEFGEQEARYYKELTNNLNKALKQDIRSTFLHRGVKTLTDGLDTVLVGESVQFEAFTSSSVKYSNWGVHNMFIIKPEGVNKGAYLGRNSYYDDEAEYLYQSGTKFRILYRDIDESGAALIVLEAL